MSKIDTWFKGLTADQRVILESLRAVILSSSGEIAEELKWGQPCYSRHRLFCYLQKAKSHVTIGFQHGAALADPKNILQGTGKDMRHIKIALGDDVDEESLKALIREALRHDATHSD